MEKSVAFLNEHGEKLAGTLHLPEFPTDRAVIWGHCFTCSRHTTILRDISKKLEEKGIASLRFDFSGNGQSEGDFSHTSYTRHIAEMKQAASFLSEQGFSRFAAGGHSMGAAIAVLSAERMSGETLKISAVCALAGRLGSGKISQIFSDKQMEELRQTGRVSFVSRGRKLELREDFFTDMQKYDLAAAVAGLKIPLMVIHGDKDEVIAVENALEAKERNPAIELEIIPDADHMFLNPAHRAEIAERAAAWFSGILP